MPLQIHPHIFFESLAYIVALGLLMRNVRRDSISKSNRTSIMVGGMVGALIGAKLLVVLQHLDFIWQHPQSIILILLQAKTMVGGLLGGVIGVEITKKMIGVTQSTGDAFVYPLIVGTAIGRIGCFLTGLDDHTYGILTTLPWGVDFGDGIYRHPTQLYEILFLVILLLFLHFRSRYQYQSGQLFRFYLISYLSFRFLIDFIKPDFHPFLGLSAIQVACLIAILYYCPSIMPMFQLKPNINGA